MTGDWRALPTTLLASWQRVPHRDGTTFVLPGAGQVRVRRGAGAPPRLRELIRRACDQLPPALRAQTAASAIARLTTRAGEYGARVSLRSGDDVEKHLAVVFDLDRHVVVDATSRGRGAAAGVRESFEALVWHATLGLPRLRARPVAIVPPRAARGLRCAHATLWIHRDGAHPTWYVAEDAWPCGAAVDGHLARSLWAPPMPRFEVSRLERRADLTVAAGLRGVLAVDHGTVGTLPAVRLSARLGDGDFDYRVHAVTAADQVAATTPAFGAFVDTLEPIPTATPYEALAWD